MSIAKTVEIYLGVKKSPITDAAIKSVSSGLSKIAAVANSAKYAMLAVALPVGVFVNEAAAFDKSMAEVATISDLSKVSLKDLTDGVVELGLELGKRPDEMAKGLYQTISAGVDTADALEFMAVAGKTAIAGVSDQAAAVDFLTNAINSYGLSIKDAGMVSDVAFKTIKRGKTTLSQLAESMGMVQPISANLGVSLNELYAMMGTITKTGLNSPETVTAIRSVMSMMIKPTVELEAALRKIKDETTGVGFASGVAAVRQLGFVNTLERLNEVVGGDTAKIGKLFENVSGLNSVMTLTSNEGAAEFKSIFDEIAHSAGATEEAFKIMESSLGHRFEKQLNALYIVGMEIGTEMLPELVASMEQLTGATDKSGIKGFIADLKELMQNAKDFGGIVKAIWNANPIVFGGKTALNYAIDSYGEHGWSGNAVTPNERYAFNRNVERTTGREVIDDDPRSIGLRVGKKVWEVEKGIYSGVMQTLFGSQRKAETERASTLAAAGI